MKSIAIIGGSGYIGKHLIQTLTGEYAITSLQRNIHGIMDRQEGVDIVSTSENNRTYDIIINTSYNLGRDIHQVYAQNKEVLDLIEKASHDRTRVIHLSSLAVFGFGLDRSIAPEPVPLHKDYAYVQSKAHMEQILLQAFPSSSLSIIRLGNVWGPANNSWTQPVADALQWGLPVLGEDHAFSNITYIHHITHYISYVLKHPDHKVFHHLAEFSSVSWQQIIRELSAFLEIMPAPIKQVPFYATSMNDEIHHALEQGPMGMLKQLRDGRFSSHYFPVAFFARLQRMLKKIKPSSQVLRQSAYHPDPTFYWILTCRQEFRSDVLAGWQAPYSWEEVSVSIFNWLRESGYTIEKD